MVLVYWSISFHILDCACSHVVDSFCLELYQTIPLVLEANWLTKRHTTFRNMHQKKIRCVGLRNVDILRVIEGH